MSIYEIEQAITELSPNELAHFRQWFHEFESNAKPDELTDSHPPTEVLVKKLRGSLKGTGVMKALVEERRKG